MDLAGQLTGIERRLWANDALFYSDALDEEALLVFPETGVITKWVAVEAIRRENAEGRRWAEVRFDDVRVVELMDGVTLLTYRVDARWEHERAARVALASSVYARRDGVWKLVFHQQSPLQGRRRRT